MDRIALAKRLEGLSSVFASETPFNRDLKAMSYVLSKLSDEKFASILASDFNPDIGIVEEVESCGVGENIIAPPAPENKKVLIIKTPSDEEAAVMSAEATDKTAGMYWNKESSEAVVNYLLRDVVGMNKTVCCDTGNKLEANQVPDGSHKGVPEKPSTLKPEQTPDISASLDSDIVSKSKGAVRKEAGSKKGPGVPDGTGPMKDSPECKMNKKKEEDKKEKDATEKEATEKDAGRIKGPGVPDGTGPRGGTSQCQMSEEESKEEESKEKDAGLADVEEKRKEQKEGEAEKAGERAEKIREKEKEKEEKEKKEEDKESCMKKEAVSSFEGIELAASMDEATLDDAEAEMLSKLFE